MFGGGQQYYNFGKNNITTCLKSSINDKFLGNQGGFSGLGGNLGFTGFGRPSFDGYSAQAYSGLGTQSYGGLGTQSYGGLGTQNYAGLGTPSYAGMGTPNYAGLGTQSYGGIGGTSFPGFPATGGFGAGMSTPYSGYNLYWVGTQKTITLYYDEF